MWCRVVVSVQHIPCLTFTCLQFSLLRMTSPTFVHFEPCCCVLERHPLHFRQHSSSFGRQHLTPTWVHVQHQGNGLRFERHPSLQCLFLRSGIQVQFRHVRKLSKSQVTVMFHILLNHLHDLFLIAVVYCHREHFELFPFQHRSPWIQQARRCVRAVGRHPHLFQRPPALIVWWYHFCLDAKKTFPCDTVDCPSSRHYQLGVASSDVSSFFSIT